MKKICLLMLTAFMFSVVNTPVFAQQSNDNYRKSLLAGYIENNNVQELTKHLNNYPQDISVVIEDEGLLCMAVDYDNVEIFQLLRNRGLATCNIISDEGKKERLAPLDYLLEEEDSSLSTKIFKLLWKEGRRSNLLLTENNWRYAVEHNMKDVANYIFQTKPSVLLTEDILQIAVRNNMNEVFNYIFRNRGKIVTADQTLQKLFYENDAAGTKLYIKDIGGFLCKYQNYLGADYVERKCQKLGGQQVCSIIQTKGPESLSILKNLSEGTFRGMTKQQLTDINEALRKMVKSQTLNPGTPQCVLTTEQKTIIVNKSKEIVGVLKEKIPAEEDNAFAERLKILSGMAWNGSVVDFHSLVKTLRTLGIRFSEVQNISYSKSGEGNITITTKRGVQATTFGKCCGEDDHYFDEYVYKIKITYPDGSKKTVQTHCTFNGHPTHPAPDSGETVTLPIGTFRLN